MTKIVIKTDKAPLPIGPYSQAIIANSLVFVSGQIPIDVSTEEICQGDITEPGIKNRTPITYNNSEKYLF